VVVRRHTILSYHVTEIDQGILRLRDPSLQETRHQRWDDGRLGDRVPRREALPGIDLTGAVEVQVREEKLLHSCTECRGTAYVLE